MKNFLPVHFLFRRILNIETSRFSDDTIRTATLKMMLGIKPKYSISDKFSDEEIARAWREASRKVGPFVMPDEKSRDRQDNIYSLRHDSFPESKSEESCNHNHGTKNFILSYSWWYGVSQHFAALCILALAGYVILKLNGVWDILMQKLFE